MSGHKKTTLSRIRTYARDLEEQQTKSSASTAPKTAIPADVKRVPTTITPLSSVQRTPATTQPNLSAPVIFPPLQKDPTETPLAEIEKSFTPPEKISSPKHIPAFHELQKELEHDLNPAPTTLNGTTQKNPPVPKAASITTKKPIAGSARDTVSLSGGTVITDTKRAEFNFFSALAKSITHFFDSLKSKATTKKSVPKYTVATPERRKGVIQKATSKTGTVFTADNETLKEAIRRRQQFENQKKSISWSPNTETGYPLLETGEPTITNVTVTYKQILPKAPATPPEEPSASESPIFPPEPVSPPISEPDTDEQRWQTTIAVNPTKRVTIPEPEPIPEPIDLSSELVAPEPLQSTPKQPSATESKPVEPTKPATVKRSRPHFLFNRNKAVTGQPHFTELNSNAVTLAITGVIIGIIVIGFSIRGLFILLTPAATDTIISTNGTAILETSEFAAVTIPPGSSNSINQIMESVVSTAGPGITEVRFIDTNQQELSPQTLLAALNTRTNPNFNQSISSLRLVSLDGQQRGLLFLVTNPTTVFGAMLEWEPLLYADLASTLGIEVSTGQTGRFVDRTIGSTDVRILVVNNQEVLSYGFIDRNILLITTDTSQFTRILQAR